MGFDFTICSPIGIKKTLSFKTDKDGEFAESSKPEKKPEEAKDIKKVEISGKLVKPTGLSVEGVLTFNGKPTAFKKTPAGKSVKFGRFELKETNQFGLEGSTDPVTPNTQLSFEVEINPCT